MKKAHALQRLLFKAMIVGAILNLGNLFLWMYFIPYLPYGLAIVIILYLFVSLLIFLRHDN